MTFLKLQFLEYKYLLEMEGTSHVDILWLSISCFCITVAIDTYNNCDAKQRRVPIKSSFFRKVGQFEEKI